MPILFKSVKQCDNCKKDFEWIGFELERQSLSGQIHVEKIPNELKAHSIKRTDNGTFKVAVNCPYCDYDNIFDFENN